MLSNIDQGGYDYLKHTYLKIKTSIDVDDVGSNILVLKFKALAKELFFL